jgi:hypothetical protein
MIRKEATAPTLSAMLGELRRSQCHTSVLVVYELYRGLPQTSPKLKVQLTPSWLRNVLRAAIPL